ncbi:MAG: phosphoribosylanthranilate isomerase [Xanthomonadales bacterium]|nr:phosphoribosylanthranilate isomerase [Xanthomonadales bacterium]
MKRSRIKICGITDPDHARQAADLGVDAIGLVFVEKSPRFVTMAQAAALAQVPAGLMLRVGLFMNAPREQVEQILAAVDLDMLQFHGDETESYCESFAYPYIKAVSAELPWRQVSRSHPRARALLLDSHAAGAAGGTGQAFDWSRFPVDSDRPVILAGGLGPENVASAIEQTRPHGVDVSSGVECRPGEKDPAKMEQFVKEVHRANGS